MSNNKKVIARIKGGLGNQLFCYAAARRLALINGAELVVDDVTGFVRDTEYARQYALDNFHIPARKATPAERMYPFERYRRGFVKWRSRALPFEKRSYLEQEGLDFDERLLNFTVTGTLYLDGLWQGEGYFKDVEQTIRDDFRMPPLEDVLNKRMVEEIRESCSVAVHVRWFDGKHDASAHNVSADYYERALEWMESKVVSPHYFLFSDDPSAALEKFMLPEGRVTCVSHNRGDNGAFADLYLMAQCKHFITANSTFSWWGAWLSKKEKIVVTPATKMDGKTAWGFDGLIPCNWTKL